MADGYALADVTMTADDTGPEQGGPAAPNRPSKRERNKADKRRRIIEAATTLFESKGFEATTTAEISAAADVGTGTLYLYVESKEDLLVAVFRERVGHAWSDAFADVDPDAPVLDQVLGAFRHVTEYHEQDPALARAFFKELLFVTGPIGDLTSDFMRQYFLDLSRVLAEAQSRGLLSTKVNPYPLAKNLWASWHALMQRRFNNRMTSERLLLNLEEAFRTALVGLTPEAPESG
ncbi:MAG: TetR/AcrR family transcriptional regulator [Acidimicrobiales bacterium]